MESISSQRNLPFRKSRNLSFYNLKVKSTLMVLFMFFVIRNAIIEVILDKSIKSVISNFILQSKYMSSTV